MCNKHYLRWWKATPPERRSPTLRGLTDEDRFHLKTSKTGHAGCWFWEGARRASGHGITTFRGQRLPAAAVALTIAGVPRPVDALALHRCDHPECVNPRHLYWGTHQDNSDDAWARNRMPIADEHPAALLTNAQVIEIRERYAAGEPGPDLAAAFGIARPTLYQLTSGRKWKSIGGPRTRRRSTRKAA